MGHSTWVQHMSVQCVGGVLSVPNGVRGTETAAKEVRSMSKQFRGLKHVSECIGACQTCIGWIIRVIQDHMKSQRVGGSKGMFREVIVFICELAV